MSTHARDSKYCIPRTLTYGQDYHDADGDRLVYLRIFQICSLQYTKKIKICKTKLYYIFDDPLMIIDHKDISRLV